MVPVKAKIISISIKTLQHKLECPNYESDIEEELFSYM